MSLLNDIQMALLDEKSKIGPILLKLKFLADRLGSIPLEDWVRFETEGYTDQDQVPDYRKASITYKGTFTNGRQTLSNIGIPSFLIEEIAVDAWINHGITDPLPVIEAMVDRVEDSNGFGIDASNLKLLIEGRIYQGFSTIGLTGRIDIGAFVRICAIVRARLLNLTLELEKNVPISAQIEVGKKPEISARETAKVTNITHNVFNAPVNNITTSGSDSPVRLSVVHGDPSSLAAALQSLGLASNDAKELSEIASSEKPGDEKSSFGARATTWITSRLSKGVDGVLKIGGKVMEDDIAKLFQQFYDGIGS